MACITEYCYFCSREDTFILKKGELEKKKTYSALCWCENEVNKDILEAKINGIQVCD